MSFYDPAAAVDGTPKLTNGLVTVEWIVSTYPRAGALQANVILRAVDNVRRSRISTEAEFYWADYGAVFAASFSREFAEATKKNESRPRGFRPVSRD